MPYFLVPSLPVCSPRAHRIQSFRLIYFLWSSYTNWCIFLNVVNFNHKPIQFYLHRYINIDVCPWCLQCCCCRGRAREACGAASAPTQGTPWQGKISFLDNDFLYSILTNYLNPFMHGGWGVLYAPHPLWFLFSNPQAIHTFYQLFLSMQKIQ